MGIIDDDDRSSRRKAEEAKAAEKARQAKREIDSFLSRWSIDHLIEAVVGEAKRLFAARGEVRDVRIRTRAVTQNIADSEKCQRVLMEALQRIEPSTQRVTFEKPYEDSRDPQWGISVSFRPPLT